MVPQKQIAFCGTERDVASVRSKLVFQNKAKNYVVVPARNIDHKCIQYGEIGSWFFRKSKKETRHLLRKIMRWSVSTSKRSLWSHCFVKQFCKNVLFTLSFPLIIADSRHKKQKPPVLPAILHTECKLMCYWECIVIIMSDEFGSVILLGPTFVLT